MIQFQKVFNVPLVLHTIGEDERAFLHCTSSVMLRIPSFYRAGLAAPSTTEKHQCCQHLLGQSRAAAVKREREREVGFETLALSSGPKSGCGRAGFFCHSFQSKALKALVYVYALIYALKAGSD